MSKFDGLTPCMRVEILLDPDTGDMQTDISGKLEDIKNALRAVLKQLENPEIIEQFVQDNDDFVI